LENKNLQDHASEEQTDRYQGDAWEELIGKWLAKSEEFGKRGPQLDVSVAEVLEKAIGAEQSRWTQADQNRVVRCLTSMGFTKYRPRNKDGSRTHRYRREEPEAEGQGLTILG
jgi:predicted P-loop ATPase